MRTWGGVLEHPAGSRAWEAFGLRYPPRSGGWVAAGDFTGWTCCVDQGHYGHRAQKATWLYAVGVRFPPIRWGRADRRVRIHQTMAPEARRRIIRTGTCQALSKRQRLETPVPFRDLLLDIARTAKVDGNAVSEARSAEAW